MRALKLRYKWNGSWYYIDLRNDNNRAKFEAFESVNNTTPLEEYTGRKYKGIEVYESDLYELRVNGIETHVEIILCKVKWSVKGCGFGFFLLTKDSEQPNWIGMNDKNIISKKRLGNIHDNPDLL